MRDFMKPEKKYQIIVNPVYKKYISKIINLDDGKIYGGNYKYKYLKYKHKYLNLKNK
jgi:hypothetical protein